MLVAAVALVVPALGPGAAEVGAGPGYGKLPVRVECGHPRRLALQHFEDGSAKLWCGRRLLARISVPW